MKTQHYKDSSLKKREEEDSLTLLRSSLLVFLESGFAARWRMAMVPALALPAQGPRSSHLAAPEPVAQKPDYRWRRALPCKQRRGTFMISPTATSSSRKSTAFAGKAKSNRQRIAAHIWTIVWSDSG